MSDQSTGCGALIAVAFISFMVGRCSVGDTSSIADVSTAPAVITAPLASSDAETASAPQAAADDAAAVLADADETAPSGESGDDYGMQEALGSLAPADEPMVSSGDGYIDSEGHHVDSPTYAPSAPPGASAQCRDGTYSFSHSRRGTCSHHGGVAQWL